MALIKIGDRYINLTEIQTYKPKEGEILFSGRTSLFLNDKDTEVFNWFLDAVKGPTFGIFDAGALFLQRDELAARQKEREAAEEALPGVEDALEVVKASATSLGKPLTPEQIEKARGMIKEQKRGQLIPLSQRKQ